MTAGFVTGRNKQKFPYYFCWNKACTKRLSVSAKEVETAFVALLTLCEGSLELLDLLPSMNAAMLSKRVERLTDELNALVADIRSQETLKHRTVMLLAKGTLSEEMFADAVQTFDAEIAKLKLLVSTKESEIQDASALAAQDAMRLRRLAAVWLPAGLTLRQELQAVIFPDGLVYSRENGFFETGNALLHQELQQLMDALANGSDFVQDGRP